METAKIRLWKNGVKLKVKNKSISVSDSKDQTSAIIQLKNVDKEADVPACEHHCLRGKVRVTTFKLSEAGVDALLVALMQYKKLKFKQKIKQC